MAQPGHSAPFPTAAGQQAPLASHPVESAQQPSTGTNDFPRSRGENAALSTKGKVHDTEKNFETSDPPEGVFAATGELAASLIATRNEQPPRQPKHRQSFPPQHVLPVRNGSVVSKHAAGVGPEDTARETSPSLRHEELPLKQETSQGEAGTKLSRPSDLPNNENTEPFGNGYHYPPKYTWQRSTQHGLKSFWNYFLTPIGFFVTIYGLNVVAWGGMLFLLLCNASPAMCAPTCNDLYSPRRVWIEWDSQILNALFCVTGFGLAPWRFRDLYYLLKYRVLKKQQGVRKLAGIHRGWLRLPGSEALPLDLGPDTITSRPEYADSSSVPYPAAKVPDAPLTGLRAPPTKMWKLDFAIWSNVANTFLQVCLATFMWAQDRFTRPSWATGLFVALACMAAAMGGIVMFKEGKRVKGIEGVPLTSEDREKLRQDEELGVRHYNNLRAKKPKSEEDKKTKKGSRKGSKRSKENQEE